jgi:hypothetical protein
LNVVDSTMTLDKGEHPSRWSDEDERRWPDEDEHHLRDDSDVADGSVHPIRTSRSRFGRRAWIVPGCTHASKFKVCLTKTNDTDLTRKNVVDWIRTLDEGEHR